eukprot:822706_1
MTAKTVKNKAKINKELTKSQLMRRIQELEAENAKLKARVIELETQMLAAGLDVERSSELYEDQDGMQWSSGDDIEDGKSGKKKKKKRKESRKKKLSIDEAQNSQIELYIEKGD